MVFLLEVLSYVVDHLSVDLEVQLSAPDCRRNRDARGTRGLVFAPLGDRIARPELDLAEIGVRVLIGCESPSLLGNVVHLARRWLFMPSCQNHRDV